MATIRSSPSGPLVDAVLAPIASETVLANPESDTALPVGAPSSALLDFLSALPASGDIAVRRAGEWQLEPVNDVVATLLVESPGMPAVFIYSPVNSAPILASYNVAASVDPGAGLRDIIFTRPFASVNYCAIAGVRSATQTTIRSQTTTDVTVGSIRIMSVIENANLGDPTNWYLVAFGDLAPL